MKQRFDFFKLLQTTTKEWLKGKATTQAAALSYYMIFSLAPLIIMAIEVSQTIFEKGTARRELVAQVEHLSGSQVAQLIDTFFKNPPPSKGWFPGILGGVIAIFGASGAFSQLQSAFNGIWEMETKPNHFFSTIVLKRFLTFAMVLVIIFLLTASLFVSAVLSSFHHSLKGASQGMEFFWSIGNEMISILFLGALFASMFKILPDVRIPWKNVWIGAAISAFLFEIGKFLIGFYLGNSVVVSAYGAAGSVVLLLFWFFYSAQILLFGAQFTRVFAQYSGDPIIPKSYLKS
ncbi:MAG: YihY/virulence factor BrkB family protein [Verrucomicrobiota bacterium]